LFYTDILKRDWRHIHHAYNFIPWKKNWRLDSTPPHDHPHLYHYFNLKPWDSSITEYSDLSEYYQYVIQAYREYPVLREYITVTNTDSRVYVDGKLTTDNISSIASTIPIDEYDISSTPERENEESIHSSPVHQSESSILHALSPDELEQLSTTYTNADTVLYRCGTLDEGSCFFHSILKAVDSGYSDLTHTQRKKYVAKLRKKMSSEITFSDWRRLAGGYLSSGIVYTEFIRELTRRKLRSVVQTISRDIRDKDIFDYISGSGLSKTVTDIFQDVSTREFEKFVAKTADPSVWVGHDDNAVDLFEYISDYFDIDIYVIRDSTRGAYRSGACKYRYHDRLSVVVLSVGESHYESIGKLNGDDIVSILSPSDDLIERLNRDSC
jgi:lipopolysaccharide biosynthesis glycosyltransferase